MIVITGASRAQLGLDPDVFEREVAGSEAVMLAVDGSSCLPVLEDIAARTEFRGLLVCSFHPTIWIRHEDEIQQDYTDHYRRLYESGEWVNACLDQWLAGELQSRLAFATGRYPDQLIHDLILTGSLPAHNYIHMRASRHREAEYHSMPEGWLEEHRRNRVARVLTSLSTASDPEPRIARRDEVLPRLVRIATLIRERGGRVVFVTMPTTAESREHARLIWPRELFWDRLSTAGLLTVHFEDYPSLSHFDCPDTSHLNCDDAVEFTRSLIEILRQKNLLPHGDRR